MDFIRAADFPLTTWIISFVFGADSSPIIVIGAEGPALIKFFPEKSSIFLILPKVDPATISCPTFKFPVLTNTVATGPFWGSRWDSKTTAKPSRFESAWKSSTSATRSMLSKRPSMPIFFLALISELIILPPHSSMTIPLSANSCFTLRELASGLSTLFIATIVGIFFSLRYAITSFVCGRTPSSAATTKTAISAMPTPLSRMAEKASCPGVSTKVITFPLFLT